MSDKRPIADINDDHIEVSPPKTVAAGIPGVTHSMGPALAQMGVIRTVQTMTAINQKHGFDCMSCAWPDPDHRKPLEFCENGAKAVTWEATPVTVPTSFWAEHPIDDLLTRSEYWLGMQGRLDGGFVLPNGPRDSRTFPTETGKAMLTVNQLEHIDRPPGRLLLQTMRSHDQFNTTIYSNNDRYRGIKNGRHVVFVNPEDLAELGLSDGETVDVHSEFTDNVDRVLRGYRIVAYPSARGCAAAYFPEANALVPLDLTAEGSNTPVSKSIVVRLERSAATG